MDTYLSANWIQSWKITFNSSGGTPATSETWTTANNTIATLPVPSRTGYIFGGWWEITGALRTRVTEFTQFYEDKTLEASWIPIFTVSFSAGTGGSVTPTSASTGADSTITLTELPIPSRAGYAFAGWFTASTGGSRVYLTQKYSANTTIYAQWTAVTYTVTFDPNGGTASESSRETLANWTLGGSMPTAERNGYTLAGWYTTSAATGGTSVGTNTVFTEDATIYARWTRTSYTITYALNSGTLQPATPANPSTYNVETETFTLRNPSRTGYTFLGWTTPTESSPQTTMTVTQGSTGNLTFTANWSADVYTVSFDARGGSASFSSATTNANWRLASLPTVDPREGYTFGGWFSTAVTGGREITTTTTFVSDSTVYARWTPVNYAITYVLNGGTVTPANPANYNIETPTFTLRNPVRPDFAFTGWTSADNSYPEETMTINQGSTGARTYTANWEALPTYRITFNVNYTGGTSTSAATKTDGMLANLPTPTRSGYAFAGWFTDEEGGTQITTSTVFMDDATVYAMWVEAYTVTFNAAGGSVNPSTATTNAAGRVTLPTPTRSGFAFAGWFMSDGDMQVTVNTVFSENTTVYAQWVVAYTITFNAGGGTVSPSSASTDATGRVNMPTPTRSGFTFDGWFTAATGGEAVSSATVFEANATVYAQWTQVIVSIGEGNRDIGGGASDEVSVVTPVVTPALSFTAGPNPVSVSAGAVKFYYSGRAVKAGSLTIYNAAGSVVRKVSVSENVTAWDLKDTRGNIVPAGTYLARGVITSVNGEREKVSLLISVR